MGLVNCGRLVLRSRTNPVIRKPFVVRFGRFVLRSRTKPRSEGPAGSGSAHWFFMREQRRSSDVAPRPVQPIRSSVENEPPGGGRARSGAVTGSTICAGQRNARRNRRSVVGPADASTCGTAFGPGPLRARPTLAGARHRSVVGYPRLSRADGGFRAGYPPPANTCPARRSAPVTRAAIRPRRLGSAARCGRGGGPVRRQPARYRRRAARRSPVRLGAGGRGRRRPPPG